MFVGLAEDCIRPPTHYKGGASMVELVQMSDGYYILRAKIGALTLEKALMDADKPIEEVSTKPATNGFILRVPSEYVEA
jgi:hypothetical protein